MAHAGSSSPQSSDWYGDGSGLTDFPQPLWLPNQDDAKWSKLL